MTIKNLMNFYNNTKKNHISNFNGDELTKYIISSSELAKESITNLKLNIIKKSDIKPTKTNIKLNIKKKS